MYVISVLIISQNLYTIHIIHNTRYKLKSFRTFNIHYTCYNNKIARVIYNLQFLLHQYLVDIGNSINSMYTSINAENIQGDRFK